MNEGDHWLNRCLAFIKRIPLILRYGLVLAAGLILLKTLEYQLFSYRFSLELYTGLLAGFFMLVGLAVGLGWFGQKSTSAQAESPNAAPAVNEEPLTPKELKLLSGIAQGLSNQQLAEQEFLSVNTVKTHLQKTYRKLGVNSRHQAVAKVKALGLLEKPVASGD